MRFILSFSDFVLAHITVVFVLNLAEKNPMPSNEVPSPDNDLPIDARVYRLLSAEERAAKELEAIEAIVARVAVQDQQELRGLLRASGNGFVALQSPDPEINRQFAILKAIWHAAAPNTGNPPSYPDRPADPAAIIDVRVALVAQMEPANVRARVVRAPEDGGVPLLILREADVSPTDLILGMRLAAQSLKKYGRTSAENISLDYTSERMGVHSAPRDALEPSQKILEALKTRKTQEVAGFGPARVLTLATRSDDSPTHR